MAAAPKPIRTAIVGESVDDLQTDERLRIVRYSTLGQLFNEAAGDDPELIVVSQSWSDQYVPSDVRLLPARFPLARVICGYGPLCEADGRTRQVWPVSQWVPDWKLAERLEREIDVLRHGRPALPITATREELVEFEQSTLATASRESSRDSTEHVCLFTPDVIWGETLQEFVNKQTDAKLSLVASLAELNDRLKIAQPASLLLDVDPIGEDLRHWLQTERDLCAVHRVGIISNSAAVRGSLLREFPEICFACDRFDWNGITASITGEPGLSRLG